MNDRSVSRARIPTAIDLARSLVPLLPSESSWTASYCEAFDDKGARYAELTRAHPRQ